jgi:hypothetical protein
MSFMVMEFMNDVGDQDVINLTNFAMVCAVLVEIFGARAGTHLVNSLFDMLPGHMIKVNVMLINRSYDKVSSNASSVFSKLVTKQRYGAGNGLLGSYAVVFHYALSDDLSGIVVFGYGAPND